MAWLIIGCTLLIIICLGGGKRLALIISSVIGIVVLIGLIVGAISVGGDGAAWAVITICAFFTVLLMFYRRGVEIEVAYMRKHDQDPKA